MWGEYQKRVEFVTAALDTLGGKERTVAALLDQESVMRARAFGTRDEIAKVEWGARYNQLLEQRKALNLDITPQTLNELIYEEQRAKEQDKIRADADKEKSTRSEMVPLLREEATILQGIRQQQELIQSAPFMGADQKSVALLHSYAAELEKVKQIITELQAKKASGGLDPAQIEQANQKLQQSNFEVQSLNQKILALQQPLRTELTNWAAGFGTTAHQIGTTIEQTIGASLASREPVPCDGKV